jgi:hypothetical protein
MPDGFHLREDILRIQVNLDDWFVQRQPSGHQAMITPNSKAGQFVKSEILTRIVSEVLTAGAVEFEVEYKDGNEEICVMHGPVGFGIASLRSSSEEAQELRAQLYKAKRKPGKLRIDGVEYLVRSEIFDSFGEDAFRVSITPNRQ